MFYEKQPDNQKNSYKQMLKVVGSLSQMFSESECPYLSYRAHENIFCKYFDAENLARLDCSADAKKEKIGIGLKTWMGQDDQKIAEFGRLRETFASLSGIELVKKIAEYRNERIRITKNLNGIESLIYHVVKRIPGAMQILEYSFDYIDLDNLNLLDNRGNVNNTYFTDGRHVYHFSSSKNTLYMIFEDMALLDSFEVEIIDDPYSFLLSLTSAAGGPDEKAYTGDLSVPEEKEQLCLRLYSVKRDGTKFVPNKSGLNQWNASGRRRDPDEVYIAYQSIDRNRAPGFFPPRDVSFNLHLPDGHIISAKVCQDSGKAIMSNPNKVLGKWLLRNVFELPEGTLVTYEMLEKYGIDSVVFTKLGESEYSVDFSELGTYEKFYNLETNDSE